MSVDAQGKSLTGFELSYEDVEVGDHFETPSREVTAAAIEAFAEMTGDRFEIHMSDEAALRHGFPARVAHGLLVLSLVEHYGQIDATSTEAWHRVISVNQTGTLFGMREIVPVMKRNGGGSIVNFSSIWGTTGAAGAAPYQAAK